MDVLAVPASGFAVERQFSVSGKMTLQQRNRLSPKIISDVMIYKAALAHTRCPLHAELDNVNNIDQVPIAEKEGIIPEEWMSGWWLTKLERGLPSKPIIDIIYEEDEDEDLYGQWL